MTLQVFVVKQDSLVWTLIYVNIFLGKTFTAPFSWVYLWNAIKFFACKQTSVNECEDLTKISLFLQKSDLEEKPVTPNPTPEPEDTPEIETILDEQPSKVSEPFLQPPVEDLKNSANSSAEPTPKKSRNKKNKIKIEEVEADEPSEVDVVQTVVTNDVDNEIRTSSSGSGNGHVVEEKKNAKSKKKKAKDDISGKVYFSWN